MSVAIMTDTNSGISPAEGEQYGICVVSMPIIIDDEEFFCCTVPGNECYTRIRERVNFVIGINALVIDII